MTDVVIEDQACINCSIYGATHRFETRLQVFYHLLWHRDRGEAIPGDALVTHAPEGSSPVPGIRQVRLALQDWKKGPPIERT